MSRDRKGHDFINFIRMIYSISIISLNRRKDLVNLISIQTIVLCAWNIDVYLNKDIESIFHISGYLH